MSPDEIRQRLFELQDTEYRDFQIKLTPGLDESRTIGVRTPLLRSYAKELFKKNEFADFISVLPHKFYDEYNLHGFIISQIKDYDECIMETERFLPFVDNWATCDLLSPKVFAKNRDKLIVKVKEWVSSSAPWTIRFGIEMLMTHFLDDDYRSEYLEIPLSVASDFYYVKMMVAWFFATALAKQYDDAVKVMQDGRLEKWTHNKTIRKACESYRITEEQKSYLKGYVK